jgi:hypothetical protein
MYFLNLHNCVNVFRLFLCEKPKIDETSFIKYFKTHYERRAKKISWENMFLQKCS